MNDAAVIDYRKHRRFTVTDVDYRPTINSIAQLTSEFSLHFGDGSMGSGSAPRGETLSCYEGHSQNVPPDRIIRQLEADAIMGAELSQLEIDRYLESRVQVLGQDNVYSLSCAFFEASLASSRQTASHSNKQQPAYCLNILNGGFHAYTNPVLSDFHEFLLVPRHGDLHRLLEDHRMIQDHVRQHLATRPTTVVNGNVVHVLGKNGNRDSIVFLNELLSELGLTNDYGLMIDAAASGLRDGSGYALELAEQRTFSRPEFLGYWRDIQDEFSLDVIEDPFAESDQDNWRRLVEHSAQCGIIGDDIHCGDPLRIRELLDGGCMTGIILKPDQAGTMSRTMDAIHTAQQQDAPIILSHRSISTDSLELAHLLVEFDIGHAKFGPLYTDYSAILKMNEVLRMTQTSTAAAVKARQSDHAGP
jgi:enolase